MKKLIIILSVFLVEMSMAQELQKSVCGHVIRHENFPSEFVTPRHVDIWLPEAYSVEKQYAVLYMHDGQMLFDPEHTWNKQSWDVDDVACQLMKENKVQDFIVVGIWNVNGLRYKNYYPQQPFDDLSDKDKQFIRDEIKLSDRTNEDFQPNSDDYLKFIVQELKPFIDENYNVYTDMEHTFMAGSSMGGLISIYAICEYPDVIGGVACMSTHWPGGHTEDNPFFKAILSYMNDSLPYKNNHKIYFDHGDQTLDAMYPRLQAIVDQLMVEKGFNASQWKTQTFPGKDHTERSWNERLHIPLVFLLGKYINPSE